MQLSTDRPAELDKIIRGLEKKVWTLPGVTASDALYLPKSLLGVGIPRMLPLIAQKTCNQPYRLAMRRRQPRLPHTKPTRLRNANNARTCAHYSHLECVL